MGLQKCFLVTGAPLTGKSTLAKQISIKENATLLSTDVVRDWMQNLLKPADNPDLFFGKGLSAKDIHTRYPAAQKLLDAQLLQNRAVEQGIIAMLKTRYLDWGSPVLEGLYLALNLCIS
jgi:2-phosphoglycerate kinase